MSLGGIKRLAEWTMGDSDIECHCAWERETSLEEELFHSDFLILGAVSSAGSLLKANACRPQVQIPPLC